MAGSESTQAKTARPHGHDVFPLKDLSRPYRLAAHSSRTRATRPVRVSDNVTIGGTEVAVIAGPCSVESAEMIASIARSVKSLGAVMLRGGAFKPRTSPYSFSGLGPAALGFLDAARAQSSLPVVTEVMDTRQVELVARTADMLQIGARNMQNFSLLEEVGRCGRPVLRHSLLAATTTEAPLAAPVARAVGRRLAS